MQTLRIAACVLTTAAVASAANWPMKGRDPQNTGRADFSVPADRAGSSFFDVFLWQKRSPGSPGEGNLDSSSLTFYDGVGPGGVDIVVGGYHWPKGVMGLNRHTGALLWSGNPGGGESIGSNTPAFSNTGQTIYVTNDATQDATYPNGHPLMAFATAVGPSAFWHNGADPNAAHMGTYSPRIAPDGRIFLHAWVDRPYAATDNGTYLTQTWAAATTDSAGLSDPVLYNDAGLLKVIIGSRWGAVYAYNGTTGAQLWSTTGGITIDATPTVDPANGHIYVGAGSDNIYIVGLTKDGQPLWSSAALKIYDYLVDNDPQRAQAGGCLSADGSTYYFQTNSPSGTGQLFAINTQNGSVKWTYPTGSAGWEMTSAHPIVTTNGVIIIGNNNGGTYYALRDAGTFGELLDTLTVDAAGNARASATLSPDGILYLPLRVMQTIGATGESATQTVQNLFTALDLRTGASAKLSPPSNQQAIAANHSVTVSWQPIIDPTGQFDHYAIYRATAAFTSVAGLTPIATVTGISSSSYTDNTALNDVAYYYAVTCVTKSGGEVKDVVSVGPRTPRDETDLQLVSISRTPRFPRYAPIYTNYTITEPSGFGPYTFSAATGLGNGQTANTQRWPSLGQPVTYTATVRNRGTNTWSSPIPGTWRLDNVIVSTPTQALQLAPGATTTFTYVLNWDNALHDLSFTINVTDRRSTNNTLTINTKSVAFLSYIDQTYYDNFRAETAQYPNAASDDFIDWLNRSMTRFNQMFAAAGTPKRVHFDILEMLADNAPNPTTDTIYFAVFPFRYLATDGTLRHSGYYNATDDIDYGLLHEMGHQLGLVDIYQLDLAADVNQVSGQGYSAVEDLMHGCSPVLSPHSAGAMTLWLDQAHGYFGQYMYRIPTQVKLRLLGFDGTPLANATVKMYQYCDRPGQGKVITNQIKATGTTDANGVWTLPNVPIDPAKVPPAFTGDTLHDNPFGYLAVIGSNGVLHFRVEYNGGIDYCWLDVTECNIAYYQGQTQAATFDRQLGLGGAVQYVPPADMTEMNANDWSAYADGSSPTATYVQDDTTRKQVGAASVKFVTDGGFDTYIRYPRTFTALWNLTGVQTLSIRAYATNPNGSFQNGSPWIRLKDADGNYFQYQYYSGGGASDLLNQAANQWRTWSIPLNASDTQNNGWRRTASGSPDLTRIQSLEIHADTWGAGFTIWFDGISFSPQPSRTDLNHDGQVNKTDYDLFAACFTGPQAGPLPANCDTADFDNDSDVDQRDFSIFQRCYGWPNLPASAKCPN